MLLLIISNKIMLQYLFNFLKSLQQWEKYQSLSFWLFSIDLYVFFYSGFGALFTESLRQFHLVIEPVRAGEKEDLD